MRLQILHKVSYFRVHLNLQLRFHQSSHLPTQNDAIEGDIGESLESADGQPQLLVKLHGLICLLVEEVLMRQETRQIKIVPRGDFMINCHIITRS